MFIDLLRALEYHAHATEARLRAQAAADATSRATLQMLAVYWEDKAKQAESGWLGSARQPPNKTTH